jgi:hypothetical protein
MPRNSLDLVTSFELVTSSLVLIELRDEHTEKFYFSMAHPIQPAAPGEGPPPAGGAMPGSPTPLTMSKTYQELYTAASNNPHPDCMAGYLAGYHYANSAGGAVPAPAALRNHSIALSDCQPMTFLCLVNGLDGPKMSIVHFILWYLLDSPGNDQSGFHHRVLDLLGDILPHQYPTVHVPNTTFHLVGMPTGVPTVAAMEALIPTWIDPRVALGPYTH